MSQRRSGGRIVSIVTGFINFLKKISGKPQ
jgi:hypothetical protein